MHTCRRLTLAFFLLTGLGAAMAPAETLRWYVGPQGDDRWSGRQATANQARTDGPIATIGRARDAVRAWRAAHRESSDSCEVIVADGTYRMTQPLELTHLDSGTATAKSVYRAASRAHPRFVGGPLLASWKPVTDQSLLQRMDSKARTSVRVADLPEDAGNDLGSPGGGGPELFFRGKPMTVARWPNEGFTDIVEVLGPTERTVRGTKGTAEGILRYDGERPARWVNEPNGWVHGYWFWDWSDQRHAIRSIDVQRHVIEVKPPYHNYGYRKGQWFYAYHLLSELDQPGEWYLDRTSRKIFFWPPALLDEASTVLSLAPSLVTLKDASFVELRGLTFEASRGTAISITGGSHNRVTACTVRNTGGWAVQVHGGVEHSVIGCDMYQLGGGGIALSGGDRNTLKAAKHLADNNHIHHFARLKRVYQPGITLQGVGNCASHNLIHDAPHMGMGFGGNDHLIELNEIYNVCYESNDAGAIYTGRNWTMRGTKIRNNYLHNIQGFRGRGCVGVYLDDMFCGTEISGNLFYRVRRAAFVGGGRDCTISNNIFVDCQPALHIDARALGWAHDHADRWIAEAKEKGTISGIRYQQPPYSTRYPKLPGMIDDNPAAPKGNLVVRNVSFQGKWNEVYREAASYVVLKDNLVDADPKFVHSDRFGAETPPRPTDFQFLESSPARAIGFQKIPLREIGLYEHPLRASWP